MRKKFSVLAYTAALLSLSPARTEAQIQITPLPEFPDAVELANKLIGSDGVTLVSAKFTGLNEGSATFTGGENFLPFSDGIVLTTGIANQLPGPNTDSVSHPDLDNDQVVPGGFAPGDQDLTDLIGGTATFNAAVLEFKFIPTNDVVSFRYVFGSEEYNEFVATEFNDVHAFFLNRANIALIPGSQVQIRINSVNAASNSQFFTDNTLPAAPLNTKLDGLIGVSRALYATGPVIPGEVNTIRLSIADVTDASIDSAVFIEEDSFVDAPPPDVCGNGFMEPTEECDDGNTVAGDGCSPTCTTEGGGGACGDGTLDPLEQCDPPDGVTCDDQCQTIPICGNGIMQPGEDCDDGNTVAGDGCSPTCTTEGGGGACGDGTLDPLEQCDPPDGVTCDDQCQAIPFVCGDGIVQPREECELPNTDTCDDQCLTIPSVCGNGIVQPGEACELPNTDTCDGQCQTIIPIACGNGIVEQGEACELPNTATCDDQCQTIIPIACGNGIVEQGEACELPNTDTCDGQCQTIPTIPIVCGNGIVEQGEECELPNTDTCDASCQTVELVEFCGDEILQSEEECDDGNTVSGDSCSPDCRIEGTGTACSDFPCGRRGRKAQICHAPPGNERRERTLCIAPSAVPAHLRNHSGDHCGPCD